MRIPFSGSRHIAICPGHIKVDLYRHEERTNDRNCKRTQWRSTLAIHVSSGQCHGRERTGRSIRERRGRDRSPFENIIINWIGDSVVLRRSFHFYSFYPLYNGKWILILCSQQRAACHRNATTKDAADGWMPTHSRANGTEDWQPQTRRSSPLIDAQPSATVGKIFEPTSMDKALTVRK